MRPSKKKSKFLQHGSDAEARVLRESLWTIKRGLEMCKDDLFGVQLVRQIFDASIIDAFDSLSEQVIN